MSLPANSAATNAATGDPLRRGLMWLAVALLAALFLAGVGRLFQLRFARGDIHPKYSSQRADPQGAKVFYEAASQTLSGAEGATVLRNYRPLRRLAEDAANTAPSRPGTLFYIGANASHSTADWPALQQLALAGWRIVIAFDPPTKAEKAETKKSEKESKAAEKKSEVKPDAPAAEPAPAKDSKASESKSDKTTKAKKEGSEKDDGFAPTVKLTPWKTALQTLGLALRTEPAWEDADHYDKASQTAQATTDTTTSAAAIEPLEPQLPWHGVAWLDAASSPPKSQPNAIVPQPRIQPLYTRQQKPVLVKCSWGRGRFFIATDACFLTNWAMQHNPAPGLLSALLGPGEAAGPVVFDETHLGSRENVGVVGLARGYHLESVFAVFAVLAALYLWANAVPVFPRRRGAASAGDTTVAGRDTSAGFVNLLRRAIPPSRLVNVCIAEWNNAFARRPGITPLSPLPEDKTAPPPVDAFAALAQKLAAKKQGRAGKQAPHSAAPPAAISATSSNTSATTSPSPTV